MKNNKTPQVTKLKDTEFFNLADKEFKIGILSKLNKLQEKTER